MGHLSINAESQRRIFKVKWWEAELLLLLYVTNCLQMFVRCLQMLTINFQSIFGHVFFAYLSL